MVKTSAAPSVCYQNHEGETVKKEPEETKRGGKFGGDVIQHYIRTDLRVPSVTGAANCFHSESKGSNVRLNEKAVRGGRGNTHKPLLCYARHRDVFISPQL